MNAAIISMGSISSERTVEEMKKVFDSVDHLNIVDLEVSMLGTSEEILYGGKPLKQYDCIYAKGSGRFANLLRAVTTVLGPECYTPIRPGAFTIGHDKLLAHLKFQVAKVPMPRTWVVSTAEAAKKILKKAPYPVVMKVPSGTHGKGVMLAESYESASSMVDALALLRQPFLIQEYVETGGTDIRAFVLGDSVVAAMKRVALPDEKRANLHAGGAGRRTELDDRTEHIAVQAAKAVGAEICGVDILQGPKGPVVIEVNLSPGIQGISKATGINVGEKIAKFLFERTKETLAERKGEAMKELVSEAKQIITKLDFRNERILLPGIITKLTKFSEQEDVVMEANKGQLKIKNFLEFAR
ncbi:MAG: RimK family alpha-L-glutamate ligase [Candidatus Aenigmarchaeota archaeon]|nr:RimK family alpha-L-glutamate ligase [Candidatus Aenigmarchaeota archaeon]